MKTKYYLITPIILILDHLTKWWAIASLAPQRSIDLIPGYLSLAYVENTGVAFGILDSVKSVWKPYALAALAIVAVVAIIIYGISMAAERRLLHLALALTIGGVLGNLVDRIFRGFVVDFIEFHIQDMFYWPNFNIADSAISVGIALLIIDTMMNPAVEKTPDSPAAGSHS